MIWSLSESGGQWQATMELDSDLLINSFGTDADGEMFVVGLNGGIDRMDFVEQTGG